MDGYRKATREAKIFSDIELNDEFAADEETPFNQASRKELSNRIEMALQQINNDQRIVVLLHDSEGYTLEEISEILQVPLGTLKSRLNRARNALRKLLSMEPFDESGRLTGK